MQWNFGWVVRALQPRANAFVAAVLIAACVGESRAAELTVNRAEVNYELWLRQLAHRDPLVRRQAVQQPPRQVDARLVTPALVRRLRDGEPSVCVAAAASLAQFETAATEALPALHAWIKTKQDDIKDGELDIIVACATAYGAIGRGSEPAVEQLLATATRLDEKAYSSRSIVCRTLGELGVVTPEVLARLSAEVALHSESAVEALGILASNSDTAREAWLECLQCLKKVGLDDAARAAITQQGEVRQEALDRLIEVALERRLVGTAQAGLLSVLFYLAPDELDTIAPAAVTLLAPNPKTPLLNNGRLNLDALRLLTRCGERAAPAVPKIVAAFLKQNPNNEADSYRQALEDCLLAIGEPAAAALLQPEIQNETARYWVALALVRRFPNIGTLLAQRLAADNDRETQWIAARAAAEGGAGIEMCVDRLIELLDSPDAELQAAAARALGAAGPTANVAYEKLLAMARGKEPAVRVAALRGLRGIAEATDDVDKLRALATAVAGRLRDSNADVRAATVEVLGSCGRAAQASFGSVRSAKGVPPEVVNLALQRIDFARWLKDTPPDPASRWKIVKIHKRDQLLLALELNLPAPNDLKLNREFRRKPGDVADVLVATERLQDMRERFALVDRAGERRAHCVGYYLVDEKNKRENHRVLVFVWPKSADDHELTLAEIGGSFWLVDTFGTFARPVVGGASAPGLPTLGPTASSSPNKLPQDDAAAKSKLRTWRDATGKRSFEAEFVALDDTRLTLRKANGEIIRLSIDLLSAADQEFIREKGDGSLKK